MRCEVLRLRDFEAVAKDWTALAADHTQAPFLHADFVGALIDEFADGSERLVRVTSNDQLLALGLFKRRGLMWETFQPSQMPIGCLVARRGAALASLLPLIGRALPGLTLGVAATQQDPLSFERPSDTEELRTLDYISTAAIDIVGSFDDYWNARGKNLRQNLRKQHRKLADESTRVTLEALRDRTDIVEAIGDHGALESAGWKAGGGTALSADNPQGRFYRKALEAFCGRDRAVVYRYRFDDRVVVVDLCVESEDTIVILKTTYDESLRTYSAASLMREEAFRLLWGGGRIKRIEFFGRAMEWHLRWSEQLRLMYHVNWYRWPALARWSAWAAQRLRPASKATGGEAVTEAN